MAESLFIGVLVVAGLVLVVAMNVHGKSRAFEDAEIRGAERPANAATSVELPAPRFNRRDRHNRRGT